MKAKIELDAADIRKVLANHYGIEEKDIVVSQCTKVLLPGDSVEKKAERITIVKIHADQEEIDNTELKECNEKQQKCECTEMEDNAEGNIVMGRAERMFRKREDWNDDNFKLVKGFVVLKCQKCGEIKSFFIRERQKHFQCFSCKAETPIDKDVVRPVYTKCHCCGNELMFRTNLTGDRIEIPCKKCGTLIPCALNKKGNAYNTVSV